MIEFNGQNYDNNDEIYETWAHRSQVVYVIINKLGEAGAGVVSPEVELFFNVFGCWVNSLDCDEYTRLSDLFGSLFDIRETIIGDWCSGVGFEYCGVVYKKEVEMKEATDNDYIVTEIPHNGRTNYTVSTPISREKNTHKQRPHSKRKSKPLLGLFGKNGNHVAPF